MSIVRPGFEQMDPGAISDGNYTLNVVSGTIMALVPVNPLGVLTIAAGTNASVDNTDPHNPIVSAIVLEPLTTETGGVPDLVWDTDNQLVMTRVI